MRKFAPSRSRKPKNEPSSTPVVPPDSVTGRSLTLVISIMCFLACLTAGAVYMINESANAWLKDIASEVTAQIEPRDGMDVDKTVRDAEAFLRNAKGISRATRSASRISKLLEPWLGQSDVLAALPVPRLIAIEIDRDAPPDIEALRAELTKRFPSASLDDHRRWQQRSAPSLDPSRSGVSVSCCSSAPRPLRSSFRDALGAGLQPRNRRGAAFRRRYRPVHRPRIRAPLPAVGIRAGFVGAVCAMVVFLGMPTVMQMLGGGASTTSEMHRLIGTSGLDVTGYLLLGAVVITISALCMLTSRFGVFRILNSKP